MVNIWWLFILTSSSTTLQKKWFQNQNQNSSWSLGLFWHARVACTVSMLAYDPLDVCSDDDDDDDYDDDDWYVAYGSDKMFDKLKSECNKMYNFPDKPNTVNDQLSWDCIGRSIEDYEGYVLLNWMIIFVDMWLAWCYLMSGTIRPSVLITCPMKYLRIVNQINVDYYLILYILRIRIISNCKS